MIVSFLMIGDEVIDMKIHEEIFYYMSTINNSWFILILNFDHYCLAAC